VARPLEDGQERTARRYHHEEAEEERIPCSRQPSDYLPKTSEIVAMVKAVEPRGVADLAKRPLETTGQIFRYAIAHELAEQNPAANIKPRDILKSTPKKNIARIDPKELPALLRSIDVYRGTHITGWA
jgi:hypothetical protein